MLIPKHLNSLNKYATTIYVDYTWYHTTLPLQPCSTLQIKLCVTVPCPVAGPAIIGKDIPGIYQIYTKVTRSECTWYILVLLDLYILVYTLELCINPYANADNKSVKVITADTALMHPGHSSESI